MGPAWAGCPGWEEGFPGQGSQTQVKIRASRHDVRSAGVRRGVGRRGPRTLPSQDPSLSHPSVSPSSPPLKGDASEATKGGILENQALQSPLQAVWWQKML